MPLANHAIVLGVDPGLTTGWCVVQVEDDLPAGFIVLSSGIVKWNERLRLLPSLIDLHRPDYTVVERFTLYEHKAQDQVGSDFPSSQVIGAVDLWLNYRQLSPPILQGAGLIAGRPPVKVLEEHEPLLHKSEHGRDAYKHCRYFICAARRTSTSKRP